MLEFNIPNITSNCSENEGVFVIEPLERGYGTTLGNSLRRVMLSSLPGCAIKQIKIDGVLHEFSTVPGVKEDVTEIVLNLKGVVLKMHGNYTNTAYIDYVGPGVVTAGDIKCDTTVEIINPAHPIATVAEGMRFYMEIGFGEGRGYQSAEKNKLESVDTPLGTIFVDSIYTPIEKVSYTVDTTRVGTQSDFDKLTVEVKTNGSITPTEAMAVASNIMIKHFEFISALSASAQGPKMVADEETQKTAVLDMCIEELDFSVRSYNCLKRAGISTVGELTNLSMDELLKIRNLGKKSLDEICAKVTDMGLEFKEEE